MSAQKVIARQGQVAFFSYTQVENIKAENNQVLSIIDLENNNIAVSMLMNAFIFEKALMREHFNESYVESDIYPKATFEGTIQSYEPSGEETQTRMIHGTFTMHGKSRNLEIKTKIQKVDNNLVLTGDFMMTVADYSINIPPLLAGNIADNVTVDFRFQFEPYEE
ncbi:YceI family protein [Maribacter sp. CXY002]|uniref:YceI family protein n=1 Tax=Maribacter luteocoastalis TaxID=3407671 RepID=UPI003B6785D5